MAGAAQGGESMGLFTVEELREVISVKVLAGQDSLSGKRRIRQISTDSRAIRRGDLFVALKGDRFDGHSFVAQAAAAGAAAVLVNRASAIKLPQIMVDDTLSALGRLGNYWRGQFD